MHDRHLDYTAPPPVLPIRSPSPLSAQRCRLASSVAFVTPITEPPGSFSAFVLSRVWAQVLGVPCWRSTSGLPRGRASGGGVLNPAWSGHSPTRRLAPWRTPV